MPEIATEERKRLEAIARANEVFDFVSRVSAYNGMIETIVSNHNDESGDNAQRRDCEAFWQRVRDLGLRGAHPCLR